MLICAQEARVLEIIAELGLRHVTHSKIGGTADIRGISGGLCATVSMIVVLARCRRATAVQHCGAAADGPVDPVRGRAHVRLGFCGRVSRW